MPGPHTTDGLQQGLPGLRYQGLAVTRTATSGGLRLALAGELDLETAPIADRALRDAEHDARELILDLRPLTFMDATGLAMVIEAGERARTAGRRFVVSVRSTGIHRLFELTRADRDLEVVVDADVVSFELDGGS